MRMPSDDPLNQAIAALEGALGVLREVQARSVGESPALPNADDTFSGETLIGVAAASERFGLQPDTFGLWCRLTRRRSPLAKSSPGRGRWRCPSSG